MITTVICLRQQALLDSLDAYMLQNPDFHVVERTDKLNVAIQAIMGVSPDLVICEDVQFGSALSILESSSRYSPGTYFLVCNAVQDPDLFLNLLRAGMNDLLPENWTEDEVWHALDRFRARQTAAERVGQAESELSLRKVLDKKFFEDIIVTDAGVTALGDFPVLEAEYGISFSEGISQALFFMIDPRPREQLLAETFLPMLELEQEARRFFGQFFQTAICYLKEDSLSLILNPVGHVQDLRLLCRKFLSECSRQLLWLNGQNTLSVGIGPGTAELQMLPLEIQAAKFAAWMRLSEGKGRVLEYRNYETQHKSKDAYLDTASKTELETAVRQGDCEGCISLATTLIRSSENSGVCISRALCINDVLSRAFNRYGQTALVESGKYLKHARNQPPAVEGIGRLELLVPMMSEWIRQCFALLEVQSGTEGAHDMRRAKNYIRTHYARQIRLEDVAAYVNLSPTYFCAKFKRETKQTFIGYLTDIRLEQAKALLTSSNLKIGQIAEQVGFQDSRHFSRVFQQQNGMLPSEYRRTVGQAK